MEIQNMVYVIRKREPQDKKERIKQQKKLEKEYTREGENVKWRKEEHRSKISMNPHC